MLRIFCAAAVPARPLFFLILALLFGALGLLGIESAQAQATGKTYALTPSVTAAEGTDAVLTVTLGEAAPPGGLAFDVRYDYSGGGATSADTGTTPGTVRVSAGNRAATISVPITADYRIVDSGETFTVTIAPAGGVTGWTVAPGGTATATVTITDNAARVTLDADAYSFREGDAGRNLDTTWRAQSYVSTSFVDVEWAGGTATGVVDYRGRSTRVGYTPFLDCQSQGRRKCGHNDGPEISGTDELSFDVVDDDLVEGDETFTVTLKPPAGWSAAPIASATVTIVDNDSAAARIAFGNSAAGTSTYTASVAENVSGGTLEVPVTVSHLPGSPTAFEIEVLAAGTAAEGADYRIATKSVTFGPDDSSKTQNLTVTIVDDADVEPGETIELRIAAADDPVDDLGDHYARNRNGSRATLTVTSDDIPLPAFEPDGSVTVTDAETDITLTFAVPVKKDADGGEFSGADLSNVLTLRTGGGTALPFTATINQAGTAIMIDPASALPDGQVRVAISNGYYDAVGNRGRAASVTFTVDSAAQSTDARLKALTASSSTDGSAFSGTLDIGTFAVDDTEYAATVANAVTHVKLTPTANEAYATVRAGRRGSLAAVDSGEASGAIALDAGENVIDVEVTAEDGSTRKTYTVTVTREQALTLTVDAANGAVAEDAGTVTVTATLDIAAGPGGLRVTLSAGSGTAATAPADYTLPGAFTIAQGRTSATAEVTIVDDDIDEDDERLVLTAAAGGLAVNGVTLTIADDDTAGVTVSDASLEVAEGATATYTVVLESKPAANVTVTPRSSEAGQATVSSPLTFTPANWDRAQPVTVTGVAEGAATVTHAVSSADAKYPSGLAIDTVAVTVVSSRTYALTPSVTAAEGTDAVLTVTLGEAAPPGGLAFDVRYDYSGGDATSADTGTTPGTVRVSAGNRTATISVPITADHRIVDSGETFTVTIAPAGGVTGWSVAPGGTATATVTITDNAARVTLDAAAYSFREGDARVTLGTTWRAQSYVYTSEVAVEWAGKAKADSDYRNHTKRVGYTPFGDCQGRGWRKCGHSDGPELTGADPLSFDVVDDDLVEGDETFTVTLRPPTGWSAAPNASATVTIEDNDAATARIAFGNSAAGTSTYTAWVAENVSGGTLEVPVTVSHLPGSSTAFEVEVLAAGTAVEGADYRIATKSVTFGPDDTGLTKNLTVAIVDDTNRESAETIELSIAAADDPVDDLGDYYARHANGSRATLTVSNDDVPLPAFNPDGSVTVTDADTDITLTFGVPVKKDADGGDFSGADLANVLTLRTADASGTALPFTPTINQARTAITIDPTSALPDGQVHVAISNGYHDAGGVRGRAASVTFTVDATAPAPTFSPADGAVVTDPTTNITLSFAEALKRDGSGSDLADADLPNILTLKATDGSGTDIPYTATIGQAGTVITIDPASNLAGGAVHVAISDGYYDAAGHRGGAASATFTVRAAKPTNLEVKEGSTRLDLEWTAPTEAHTGYDVHYTAAPESGAGSIADDAAVQSGNSPSHTAGWVDAEHAGTTASQEITGLRNGAEYRLRVRATNQGATGDWVFGTGTPRSTDATLSGLTASGAARADGTFSALKLTPEFLSGTTSYAATVASAITHVKLTPTATEANATVTVDGAAVASDAASDAITLALGDNAIDVVVTAHDGKTTKTYTVTVTRQSGDATLRGLAGTASTDGSDFSGTLTLDPAFQSGTTTYTATVASAVTHVKLTPTVTDTDKAKVTVGKQGAAPGAVTSGSASGAVALDVGDNAIEVVVTAEDGSKQTYTVTVTRQSGDATLRGLAGATSTDGSEFSGTLTLDPAFLSDTATYTATAVNAVTHVQLTPTVSESNARVTVDGSAVASDEASSAIALDLGANDIIVEVTAQDGTTQTYTVTVTRLPAVPGAPTALDVAAKNAKLDISWMPPTSGGAVAGYDVHYTSAPTSGQGAVEAEEDASGNDPSAAWVAVARTETDPPTASQAIASLDNGTTYRLRVRARNGGGESAWVTGTGTPKSDDATLSALAASTSPAEDGTFSALTLTPPTFSPSTRIYTATVGISVTHLKLTATANDGDASLQAGKGDDLAALTSGTASDAIALDGGSNAINVVVTAEDGKAMQTYTLTVTRRTPPPTALTLTTSATNGTVAENGGPVTVTATLDNLAGAEGVAVTLSAESASTATASDDFVLPRTFTISAGETSATANVRIVNDDVDEDDESLVLTATAGSLPVTGVTLTITDDDTAGVYIDPVQLSVGLGAGATAEYFVALDSQPAGDVTVTPASSDTDKATVSSALVFTPNNWSSTQSVTVTGIAVGKVSVTHGITASADPGYPSDLAIDPVAVTVSAGICDRTKAVRDALVQETFADDCALVLGSHLANVFYLYISDPELAALKAGDFDGLTGLEELTVTGTRLASLPDLSGLASLHTLDVSRNRLTSLPDLSGLASLRSLRVSENRLTSLQDLSSNLALETLEVDNNPLTSLPDLSRNTKLNWLGLFNNPLSNLSALTLTGSDGNGIDLNAAFDGDTTDYTAAAAPGVVSVTVTPTAADTGILPASISALHPAPTIRVGTDFDLQPVSSGSPSKPVALSGDQTRIEVQVEGRADGPKSYTVTVSSSTKTYAVTSAVTAAEGSDASLEVTLSEAAPSGGLELSVAYGHSGDSTATPADIGTAPAAVTVEEGETTATLTIPLADDDLVEGDETFTATLPTAVAGWYAAATGAVATVTVDDGDDDLAEIGFARNADEIAQTFARKVAESDGSLDVPVSVSHLPGAATTFGIEVLGGGTATEGTDFSIAPKSVTFGPTDTSKTKNVSVTITDDSDLERDETIVLGIAPATDPADDLGDLYARNSPATLTIENDEAPAAPTNLDVVAGDAKLDLSWDAPAGTAGALAGYDVHYTSAAADTVADNAAAGSDPAAAWVAVIRSGAGGTQTISGLDNGTEYRVRVRTAVGASASAWVTDKGTPKSGDATLSGLTAATSTDGSDFSTALTLAPDFAASTTEYTATVDSTVTHVRLIPAASDADAAVTVDGTAVTSVADGVAVALDTGKNAIEVAVTAEDGTERTYTVTVTRMKSSDATLSGLTATQAEGAEETFEARELVPPFNPERVSQFYFATVGSSVTHVKLTPTVNQSGATVTVNGVTVSSGSPSGAIELSVGENDIEAVVTAEDETTTQTYTVRVTRQSGDATLSALAATQAESRNGTYSALALSPDFAATQTSYAATVGNAVTHVKLTPRATAAGLTIVRVGGRFVPARSTSNAIELSVGENEIQVEVTAQDRTVKMTYTVTVTRLPALPRAPTGLTAKPGDGKLDLSWTKPLTGGTVAGYEVHYTSAPATGEGAVANDAEASGNDAKAGWVAASRGAETDPPTVTQEIAGLENGASYRIRVRARNAAGTSGWLNGAGTPRAPPTTLTLTTDATNNSAGEDAGMVTVTATLDRAAVSDVEVTLSAGNASTATATDDYALPPAFTIDKGETSATADVTIVDDDIDEGNETLVLTATAGSLTVTGVTLTITDGDATLVTAEDVTVAEGAGNATLTLSITRPAGETRAVSGTVTPKAGTATAGDDYTAGALDFTIAPGASTATVAIPIAQDDVIEGDESFSAEIAVTAPADGAPIAAGPAATVTITDDDSATLALAIGTAKVAEGGSFSLTVSLGHTANGSTTAKTLPADLALTVTPTFATAADGKAAAADMTDSTAKTVTLSAGSSTATVSFAIADDAADEPDETLGFRLALAPSQTLPDDVTLGTASVDATIEDGDATAPSPTFFPEDDAKVTNAGTDITLTFAEAIKSDGSGTDFTDSTVDAVITLKTTDSNGTAIGFDATIDPANKVITINPTADLAEGAVYVAITDGYWDAAGNQGSAANATFTVDTTAPTVEIGGVPQKINSTGELSVTFTFSEEVTGFVTEDVTVSGGDKGAFSGSGDSYTLAVTPAGSADVVVAVAANAATDGGNTGPAAEATATATWDAAAPTVTFSPSNNATETDAGTDITLTFAEAIRKDSSGADFADADLDSILTLKTADSSGNDIDYAATIDGANQVITIDPASNLPEGAIYVAITDGYWDAAGNQGSAASATFTVDSTAPAAPTFDPADSATETNAGTDITLTFAEAIKANGAGTDFTDSTVDAVITLKTTDSNGTAIGFDATIDPANKVITINPTADLAEGAVYVAITDGYWDAAGNQGSAASATFTVDTTAPTVEIGGVPQKINSTGELSVTFTFSEEVTGFVTEDVTVSGGDKGAFSGSGDSYTLAVTPTGSADVVVTVAANAATDGTNTGPASAATETAAWDAAAPTVTITGLPSKINSTDALSVTFTWSEDVTEFVTGDVAVTGGTKGTFASTSARVYTLAVTPSGSADVVVTVVCAFTLFKGVPFTFFDGIFVRFCPRRGSRKRFRLDPPVFLRGNRHLERCLGPWRVRVSFTLYDGVCAGPSLRMSFQSFRPSGRSLSTRPCRRSRRRAPRSPALSASYPQMTRPGFHCAIQAGSSAAAPPADRMTAPGGSGRPICAAERASTALSTSMTAGGGTAPAGSQKLPAALRDPAAMPRNFRSRPVPASSAPDSAPSAPRQAKTALARASARIRPSRARRSIRSGSRPRRSVSQVLTRGQFAAAAGVGA